jgi:uncharacterized protein
MICIYHSKDFDGYCSAAIVKKKFPEVKLIGHDHGLEFDLTQIENEPVYIVDISFPIETMIEISKRSSNQLTWIDHHLPKMKEYVDYISTNDNYCRSHLNDQKAACELTWEYLFPELRMPIVVDLLGKLDTYRNHNTPEWYERILPFQFGIMLKANSPETFPVMLLENDIEYRHIPDIIDNYITKGKMIMEYQEQQDKNLCKKAFEIDFYGYRAICVNGTGGSETLKSVYDPEKHDIMILFTYNGKFWTVSLRSTKDNVDCSSLAAKFGGSGHFHASGLKLLNINEIIK